MKIGLMPNIAEQNCRSAGFYPAILEAKYKTAAPRMIRYTANGANPLFLTQPMNHATAP
jgi:hypothetical protein